MGGVGVEVQVQLQLPRKNERNVVIWGMASSSLGSWMQPWLQSLSASDSPKRQSKAQLEQQQQQLPQQQQQQCLVEVAVKFVGAKGDAYNAMPTDTRT